MLFLSRRARARWACGGGGNTGPARSRASGQMLFGIVPMLVLKDFVPDCFVAQICANSTARTHILAHRSARRSDPEQNPLVRTLENGTIPKNMFTNFEHKRLKPKLDIFEKPKNRVHKLTDSNSNGALSAVALSLFAGLLLCCIEQTRLGARVYLFVLTVTLEKGARRAYVVPSAPGFLQVQQPLFMFDGSDARA